MPNHNSPVNAFKKGNQLHTLAQKAARPKAFPAPDILWQAACGYFQYCVDNPLQGYAFHHRGLIEVTRMRAMSWRGLYRHLGVANLQTYRHDPGYTAVIERIMQVMYVYNFTGAAACLLNYKIIKQKLFPDLPLSVTDFKLTFLKP